MIEKKINCESNNKPKKYSIENILKGKCDIVLIENIEEHLKENENAETIKYYTYDMYRIKGNNYRDTLENDLIIEAGFLEWLNFAKREYENQVEKVSLEERLSTAEAVIAEILGGEV